jgi:hypothetical protein
MPTGDVYLRDMHAFERCMPVRMHAYKGYISVRDACL